MQDEKSNGLWTRGLQQASDLLIRRGTAMGPLTPLLLLVPFFLAASYAFSSAVWASGAFAFVAVAIVFEYCRQFSRFARHDPDRLQSEEYRYEMKKIQMVAAKELPYPMSADHLHLPGAASNPAHPLPDVRDIPIAHDSTEEERK